MQSPNVVGYSGRIYYTYLKQDKLNYAHAAHDYYVKCVKVNKLKLQT